MAALTLDTPTGPFTLIEQDGAITKAAWRSGGTDRTALLSRAADQIRAYFGHELERFELPLHVEGSQFQRDVCEAMCAIPFGHTRTYGDLARDLNAPAQSIGQACGGNPIPLIIPCHRILGATNLGGFSGTHGVETKVALLKHEGAASLLI